MTGIFYYLSLMIIGLNLVCFHANWGGIMLVGGILLILCHFYRTYLCYIAVFLLCGSMYFLHQRLQITQVKLDAHLEQKVTLIDTHMNQCTLDKNILKGQAVHRTSHAKVKFSILNLQNDELKRLSRYQGRLVIANYFACQKLEKPGNFYQFDYKKYCFSKGIMYQLVAKNSGKIYCPQLSPWSWSGLCDQINAWHLKLINWFERCPAGLRDYGETLLLGYVRPDFYHDNEGIQTIGLIHLFSISGFQVQMICRLWRFVCRHLRVVMERRLFTNQFILAGFWLFACETQSLIRSVIAAILANFKQMGYFKLNRFDLWGMTIMLSLLLIPGLLGQLGGQLTCLLSFGLLWTRAFKWWQQTILLNILILPLILWHTFSWHPVSIIINLLIVPFFTYCIMPIVIIGIVSYGLKIMGLVTLTNAGICYFRQFLMEIAELPGEIYFGKPVLWGFCLLFIVTIYGLYWNAKGVWILLSVLYMGIGLLIQWQQVAQIVFFDVGQGDATYIKTIGGENVLVDVGGKMSFNQAKHFKQKLAKLGAQPIVSYLKANGISKIDYLILTHKDIDHIGNLLGFLKYYQVKHLIVPAGMEKQRLLKSMLLDANRPQLVPQPVIAPVQLTKEITIIAPDHIGTGVNADSIGLLLQNNWISAILTGDLDQAGERRMLKQISLSQIDILKFGHHGSKTSTAPELMAHLKPKMGIVSAGKLNRFNHPSPEVLTLAREYHVKVWQTAQQGMIRVREHVQQQHIDFGVK